LAEPTLDVKILKAVGEHATELKDGKVLLGDPLGAESAIVDATKQVFRSLLRQELGLQAKAFDQDEKEDAMELQAKRVAGDDDEGALDELVELFSELCDRWPEVLDLRYGGTRADFREFRTVFLPALLSTLVQWSHEKQAQIVTSQLKAISRDYEQAVRSAEGARAEPYEAGDEDE